MLVNTILVVVNHSFLRHKSFAFLTLGTSLDFTVHALIEISAFAFNCHLSALSRMLLLLHVGSRVQIIRHAGNLVDFSYLFLAVESGVLAPCILLAAHEGFLIHCDSISCTYDSMLNSEC